MWRRPLMSDQLFVAVLPSVKSPVRPRFIVRSRQQQETTSATDTDKRAEERQFISKTNAAQEGSSEWRLNTTAMCMRESFSAGWPAGRPYHPA